MNRYEIRKQFGRHPDIYAVLIYSLQHALKGVHSHPDSTRQRKAKIRSKEFRLARKIKMSR